VDARTFYEAFRTECHRRHGLVYLPWDQIPEISKQHWNVAWDLAKPMDLDTGKRNAELLHLRRELGNVQKLADRHWAISAETKRKLIAERGKANKLRNQIRELKDQLEVVRQRAPRQKLSLSASDVWSAPSEEPIEAKVLCTLPPTEMMDITPTWRRSEFT
jgi:hypothetical protein